jgi:hypothetical protein
MYEKGLLANPFEFLNPFDLLDSNRSQIRKGLLIDPSWICNHLNQIENLISNMKK